MGKDFEFKRLKRHQVGGTRKNMELGIPAPTTPSGKVYRMCPTADCEPKHFLLGQAPVRPAIPPEAAKKVRRDAGTDGTTCPYCGHDGPDEDYMHSGDIKAIEQYIEWAANQDVGDYMDGIVREFNRQMMRSCGGLFDISMNVQKSHSPRPSVWREDLLRDITCHICGTPYGVYATALFCPDCGHPNLGNHFSREVELIDQQLQLAAKTENDGNKELAYRLLGNAHEDVLTAFEAFQKVAYRYLVRCRTPDRAVELCHKRAIGNRFQNIQRGTDLWANVSLDPYGTLDPGAVETLRVNIEKRHVIGHNLSVVDDAYAAAASAEEPGRTTRLLGGEIHQFASICSLAVDVLDAALP